MGHLISISNPLIRAITGKINGIAGVAGSHGPWFGGILYDKYGSYKIVFEYAILSFVFSAVFFILSAPRRKIIKKHFYKDKTFRKQREAGLIKSYKTITLQKYKNELKQRAK